MSETKRRSKQAESDSPEMAERPRQTRVTLAKDVSSKYRKVMPKSGGPYEGGDGSAPPRRRGPGGPSPRPSRPPRKFSDSDERPSRPPRNFSGERPARPPRRFSDSEGSSRPPRPFSGERPARPPRNFGDRPARPPRSFGDRPPRPMREAFDQTALKAVAHRSLPEAAKQIQESQDILLKSAEDILRLTEQLNAVYESLKGKISETPDNALLAELETAREAVTHIFEGMSFQDLVGQRLMKVADFFKALDETLAEALKKPAPFSGDRRPPFKREGGFERKPFGGPRHFEGEKRPYKRREDGDRKPYAARGESDRKPYAARGEKPERKSRLKGPQAEGGALGQIDIDSLLKDL